MNNNTANTMCVKCGRPVCERCAGRDAAAPDQALARLIAAAPDLRRSLDRCAFLLQRIAEGDHRAVQNSLDAAEEANAAIAKATDATGAARRSPEYFGQLPGGAN